jgi:hypothetical protein
LEGKAKIELFINGKDAPVFLGETEPRFWRRDLPDGFNDAGEHFALFKFNLPVIDESKY